MSWTIRTRLLKTIPLSGRYQSIHVITPPAAAVGKYNHLIVEEKWQKYWEENKIFKAKRRPGHQKKYILDMFPYPSGEND